MPTKTEERIRELVGMDLHDPKEEFLIPIRPVPKGRPRMSRRGHAFTPARTRQFESDLRAHVQEALGRDYKPLAGTLRVHCYFAFKRPKRSSNGYPRPDLDNLVKTLDALNGLVWVDDSQIVSMSAEKGYEDDDCIVIQVYDDNAGSLSR